MCRTPEIDRSLAALSLEDRAEVLELREAFAFLYAELREAKRRFEAGEDAGRDGAIDAVEAVLKFLSRFQPVLDEGLNAPLTVLFDSLMHLDEGAVEPLLKPSRRPGRTRASALREGLIGVAVFTVRRLVETELPASEAHARVAEALRHAGVRAARGRYRSIQTRTVRGWCEGVAADFGGRGDAAQTIQELEAAIPRPEGLSPEQVRAFYLDRLVNYIHRTRGQEST